MPGEIADMMLDGLMCEGCGVWMDDFESPGYARLCAGCRRERRQRVPNNPRYESFEQIQARKPHACATCGKRFRTEAAAAHHARDAHKTPSLPLQR